MITGETIPITLRQSVTATRRRQTFTLRLNNISSTLMIYIILQIWKER